MSTQRDTEMASPPLTEASPSAGTALREPTIRGQTASAQGRMKKHRCATCLKRFDRKDTLNRHMQVHDKNLSLRKRRQKSCVYCFKSKIKCSREQPSCSTCSKRGSGCVYDGNGNGETLPPGNFPPSLANSESASSTYHDDKPNDLVSGNPLDIPSADPPLNDFVSSTQPEGDSAFSSMHPPNPFQDLIFAGPYDAIFQSGFEDSNFDWLFTDNREDLSLPLGDNYHGVDLPMNPEPTNQAQIETVPTYTHGQDQIGFMVDHHTDASPELGIPTPQNRCGPDDPWPMEWYASPRDQYVTLPNLGRIEDSFSDGSSYCQMNPITDVVVDSLRRTLQLAIDRTPGPPVSLVNFPSKEKLDLCIDKYFAQFHRILPIIHRPSFNPARDPVVLTLAIVCIGACYTPYENARGFANVLSELNRRLLLFMGEHDPRFTRTDFYVTAQVLQGNHGYSSGSKRLLELSETFRSSLVNNARNMGLFLYRPPFYPPHNSPEARWQAWVADEKMRRLGWAVYSYDSSVSYLHNKRPSITISEIQMALPSSLQLWEAVSEQAWSALHPWSDTVPPSKPFRSTMRMLFDPAQKVGLCDIGDDETKQVMVLTITRFLWSLKELHGSPIIDVVEKKFPLEGGQEDLLVVLDTFLQSPASAAAIHTKAELLNIARITQIVHMAHLYAAGDLMDWLHPLLRDGPGQERARTRMKEWAAESQVRVREVTYHCAQLLAIVRRYPYNLPLEPFNVFHAGVSLYCMAKLLPQELASERDPSAQPQSIRIDHLVKETGKLSPIIEMWIREGGSEAITLLGVPKLACSQGRLQVLEQTAEILDSMPVWGIAQNFHSVVVRLIWQEEAELGSTMNRSS